MSRGVDEMALWSQYGFFLANFMLLAVVSGITIGMGKVVTSVLAVHLGCNSLQIGIISAMESLGMVLVTVPAGFIIARRGARSVYAVASLAAFAAYLVMSRIDAWLGIAIVMGFVGLCIPFRIVSMNSSFLEQLPRIGANKAGWYRGSLLCGIGLLGPLLGHYFTETTSFASCYLIVGGMFAAMAVYCLGFLPGRPPAPDTDSSAGSMSRQVGVMLSNPTIARSCLLEFTTNSVNSVFATFIILIVHQIRGLGQEDAIALMVAQGVATVAALFGFGGFIRGIAPQRTNDAAFVATVVGLLLLGTRTELLLLGLGSALLGLGSSMIHLVNMTNLSEHRVDKSKISGVFTLAQMTGSLSGALLGGLLGGWMPLQRLFLVWGGIVIFVATVTRWQAESTPPLLVSGD